MILVRTQYWLAGLILLASVYGCSAWNGGTPSDMQASVGTTKTTTPAGIDRKGGLILQDDHLTRPY